MYICMSLFFVHLSQGRKKLLEMLWRCRIAMRYLGFMYESHVVNSSILQTFPLTEFFKAQSQIFNSTSIRLQKGLLFEGTIKATLWSSGLKPWRGSQRPQQRVAATGRVAAVGFWGRSGAVWDDDFLGLGVGPAHSVLLKKKSQNDEPGRRLNSSYSPTTPQDVVVLQVVVESARPPPIQSGAASSSDSGDC